MIFYSNNSRIRTIIINKIQKLFSDHDIPLDFAELQALVLNIYESKVCKVTNIAQ
jgi:hypothetical protein